MPEGTKRYVGIAIGFLGALITILATEDAGVLPEYFKSIGALVISTGGTVFGVGYVHKQVKDKKLIEPTNQ